MVQVISPPTEVVASLGVVRVKTRFPATPTQQLRLSEWKQRQLRRRIDDYACMPFLERIELLPKELGTDWQGIIKRLRRSKQLISRLRGRDLEFNIRFVTVLQFAKCFKRIPVLAYNIETKEVEFFDDIDILYGKPDIEYGRHFIETHVTKWNPNHRERKPLLEKFGREIGIKHPTLLAYLRNGSKPPIKNLEAIFKECGYGWMYLVEPLKPED